MKYDTNAYWSSYKVKVILVTCESGLNFQDQFSKKIKKLNLIKILQAGEELFHVDVRTDG